MKRIFLRTHRAVVVMSTMSVVAVVGATFWCYGALRGVTGSLIIHFDDESGITQVGNLGFIIQMGIVGILMVLVNSALALRLDERDRLWGKMVAGITLYFAILLFIAIAAIIAVN